MRPSRSPFFNRPNGWRLYGGAVAVAMIGLGCLAVGGWMLLDRDQAEPLVRAYLIRPRRWEAFGETRYALYLGLLLVLGVLLPLVALWIARAIPASERRLDDRLTRQLEDQAQRHTRTLD